MSVPDHNPSRRLRLFLRDHRVLDATARVPEGQHLATYLATRHRYVALADVDWLGTGETIPELALKVDTLLWAASRDDELPLTSTALPGTPRRVEMELEGGYLLAAGLLLGSGQRLGDYLQNAPAFVPLRDAELRPRGKALGDIAVNHDAVQMVREIDAEPSHSGQDAMLGADTGDPG